MLQIAVGSLNFLPLRSVTALLVIYTLLLTLSTTKMKADQDRVKVLLHDTISLLCKSGLSFDTELKIEGVLGITIDRDEVFIVHLNETISEQFADKTQTLPDSSRSFDSNSVNPTRYDLDEDSSKPNVSGLSRKHLQEASSFEDFVKKEVRTSATVKKEKKYDEDDDDDLMIVGSDSAENFQPCSGDFNPYRALIPKHRSVPGIPGRGFKRNSMYGGFPAVFRHRQKRRSVPISSACIKGDPGGMVTDPRTFGQQVNYGDYASGGVSSQEFSAKSGSTWDENHRLMSGGHNRQMMSQDSAGTSFIASPGNYDDGLDRMSGVERSTDGGGGGADSGGWLGAQSLIGLSQLASLSQQDAGNTSGGEEKTFVCEYPECSLAFAHSFTMYRHQRLKHGKRFGIVQQVTFHCPHENCERVFCREGTLNNHQRDFHGSVIQ